MLSRIKSYQSTVLLLAGLVIGGVIGVVFGERAVILKPFGDLFLNLMFMILIPLVFFSLSSAIASMSDMSRLGKIIGSTFFVFIVTALISGIVGYIGAVLVDPLKAVDTDSLKQLMNANAVVEEADQSLLEQLVNTFTVGDFQDLLSKKNMLATIVFSLLIGVSTSLAGEAGKSFSKFLEAGNAVMLKSVSVIMLYAPIGLGAFFAATIGSLGSQIIVGYARIFILYTVLTLIYFFGVMSLYAYIASGREGVTSFWKNIAPAAITAIATCSSAACIPINLEVTKNMGVSDDIVETVIPLGANTHKDGSVIGGVLKIAFLFSLFGRDIATFNSMISIIMVAFLVGMVMGAVPGGGMVAETVIISLFGFPLDALPLVLIISMIIDIPATLLNSSGNTVSAMLVARMVDGKEWLVTQKEMVLSKKG